LAQNAAEHHANQYLMTQGNARRTRFTSFLAEFPARSGFKVLSFWFPVFGLRSAAGMGVGGESRGFEAMGWLMLE
jgi:hypothetical protein